MQNISASKNIEVDTNTPKAAKESVARLAYLLFHIKIASTNNKKSIKRTWIFSKGTDLTFSNHDEK